LALGWTAIPEAITKVTKDTDNPFLGITVGLFKGIANAFARTTSGVADVVTILDPKQEPVIKDEMVSLETSVSSKGSNISPSKTVKIK
jgi:putative exosortase-associated protein (TIGR04073 family)